MPLSCEGVQVFLMFPLLYVCTPGLPHASLQHAPESLLTQQSLLLLGLPGIDVGRPGLPDLDPESVPTHTHTHTQKQT